MDDRRELLKLKQGLISEEDSTLEIEQKPHIEKPVGFTAVMSNFLYHHKIQLIIGGFFAAAVISLIFMSLGKESPDITILLISDDSQVSAFLFFESATLREQIESFTPDFNGDGSVNASCLFIDLVTQGRDPQAIHGNAVKLFAEMQSGNSLMFIGNRAALEAIPHSAEVPLESFYLNLSERYPDNPAVVGDFFLQVSSTELADVEFTNVDLPEDLFIVIRINANRADVVLGQSLIVLDNIVASM
jgi:hypothetical protein